MLNFTDFYLMNFLFSLKYRESLNFRQKNEKNFRTCFEMRFFILGGLLSICLGMPFDQQEIKARDASQAKSFDIKKRFISIRINHPINILV